MPDSQPRLIALDWGTSSLRAYLLGADACVLEQRHLPRGLMQLPNAGDGAPGAASFEAAFADACGDWLRDTPQVPVIAAGMVGSAQGWCEAPYVDVPASVDRPGGALTVVRTASGQAVHIVPGLRQRGMLPNVMRGEETQVIGALHACATTLEPRPERWLIGLPGTHSKWVSVHRQTVERFHTFMTGEVYAALRQHTILGRTMQHDAQNDDAAFVRGVRITRGESAAAGMLSTIFSCRTLGLTGALSPRAQADYLSGLLIGHELAGLEAAEPTFARDAGPAARIVLVGDSALCRRYRVALSEYGHACVDFIEHATPIGLWKLACVAGLVHAETRSDAAAVDARPHAIDAKP
jgi:2-dehydro-3-deoxygalactonokinase